MTAEEDPHPISLGCGRPLPGQHQSEPVKESRASHGTDPQTRSDMALGDRIAPGNMCKVSCLSRVSIKLIDLLIVCNFWLLPSSASIPQNNHRHCLWRYAPVPNMAALVMVGLHVLASISMGEWWAAVCKSVAISPWILFVCLVLKVKTLSGGFMQMSPCNLHTIHWPAKNQYIDHIHCNGSNVLSCKEQ